MADSCTAPRTSGGATGCSRSRTAGRAPGTAGHRRIDGFTLQLDLRDGICRGIWAERTFPQGRALKELVHSGDVVIDAGANIGYMSLIAARGVGPTGRVIAIEPAQRAFSLLELNAGVTFQTASSLCARHVTRPTGG